MGKKLIVLLAMLIAAASAQAKEEFTFVGVGAMAGTMKFEDDVATSDDTDLNTVSLRIGKQTHRARTIFEIDYTGDYVGTGLFIDYIPFDTFFNTPKLRPYIGLHAQYLRYDDDIIDEDGFGIGTQTGFMFYTTESVDLDLSYRYTFIRNSDDLDSNYGFNISLHYFFE
jgi:opacity protein-like surface antigen